MEIFLMLLFGALGGSLGGMGMGGGTVLIPLLTIFLGFDQKLAQGVNLISFLIMAIFALIIHLKNGYVENDGILPIIIPGMIFSVGGSLIVGIIPSNILKIAFGVFLILISLFEFYKVFKKQRKEKK